jgi:hypothetical protein
MRPFHGLLRKEGGYNPPLQGTFSDRLLAAMPFTLLAMKRRERRQLGGFSLAEYLAEAGWQPALPDRDKMPLFEHLPFS